jgi:ABC-2 type transport system ATP-binding protein
MPPDLVRGAAQSGGWWSFPFDDFAEVEPLLARIRAADCRIDDLEIGKPDLEEVFIRVMQGQAEAPAT